MSLDNQHAYWDSVAQTKTFTHPVNIPLLEGFVGKEDLIVDYGCGYGRIVKQLGEAGFANVTGFDTSAELVKRGLGTDKLRLIHINQHADLPLEDKSVDCFLLFAVLTCIPSNEGQRNLLSTLHTKLKPQGHLFISDYYLQENSSEMDRYEYLNNDADNYGVFSLPEGATVRHHTKEWVAELLQDFYIVKEESILVSTMNGHQATAFQIIAQKK